MPTMNTTANKSEDKLVQISAGQATLEGNLIIPKSSRGIVLFAHGSGSGRHSPRNKYVAEVLQDAGIATLLIDLLTEEEVDMQTRHLRLDIDLLAQRLIEATFNRLKLVYTVQNQESYKKWSEEK